MPVELLAPHPHLPRLRGPLILAILDGVGWGARDGGDAVHLAAKPHLQRLWTEAPTRTLKAHGTAVGMPSDADMGNSEVGHNALGAGRVFRQGAALVQDAIANGRLFDTAASSIHQRTLVEPSNSDADQGGASIGPEAHLECVEDRSGVTTKRCAEGGGSGAWRWLVEPLTSATGTLHLCGLLSDGNVHAHIDHVIALVRAADREGVQCIRIHALADGRDVLDPSFDHYVEQLQATLDAFGRTGRDYRIASGGGRMVVTMDRYEADWRIVERGWRTHVLGDAPGFPSVREALTWLRTLPGGDSDQTLGPFVITDDGQPIGRVQDGDSFAFWNFRGDRAAQFSRAFEEADFNAFDRVRVPQVRYAGMMQYDGDLQLPRRFLVEPPVIEGTSGEFLAALGLHTLAVSETQKFGHVTYFWNGNRSGVLAPDVEVYAEVPSDRIAFDAAPEMKAHEITDIVETALPGPRPPDFVRLNYANGDMVGHTGNLAATVRAIEVVDVEIGRLRALAEAAGGVLIVTADHGNADDMWLRNGKGQPLVRPDGTLQPRTSHTLAPVPLTILDTRTTVPWQLRSDLADAGLANVAATLFHVLGYEAPIGYAPSVIEPA